MYKDLVESIIQAVRTSEDIDRGVGIEPLLKEFAYEVESLGEEARADRVKKISAYYMNILKNSHSITVAYRATRKWAMMAYVQHHIQKRRAELGLGEATAVATDQKEYTLEEVENIQKVGSKSKEPGYIFGTYYGDTFVLTTINPKDITQGGDKWPFTLEDYKKVKDNKSVESIEGLMKAYKLGTKITPIVVDEENDLMDGRHRLVAQNELGKKTIQAFKRIK